MWIKQASGRQAAFTYAVHLDVASLTPKICSEIGLFRCSWAEVRRVLDLPSFYIITIHTLIRTTLDHTNQDFEFISNNKSDSIFY